MTEERLPLLCVPPDKYTRKTQKNMARVSKGIRRRLGCGKRRIERHRRSVWELQDDVVCYKAD